MKFAGKVTPSEGINPANFQNSCSCFPARASVTVCGWVKRELGEKVPHPWFKEISICSSHHSLGPINWLMISFSEEVKTTSGVPLLDAFRNAFQMNEGRYFNLTNWKSKTHMLSRVHRL